MPCLQSHSLKISVFERSRALWSNRMFTQRIANTIWVGSHNFGCPSSCLLRHWCTIALQAYSIKKFMAWNIVLITLDYLYFPKMDASMCSLRNKTSNVIFKQEKKVKAVGCQKMPCLAIAHWIELIHSLFLIWYSLNSIIKNFQDKFLFKLIYSFSWDH